MATPLANSDSNLTLNQQDTNRDVSAHSQQPEIRNGAQPALRTSNGTANNAESGDVCDIYMRKPFNERESFKNSLPEDDKKKIDETMQYLHALQAELRYNAERNKLMGSLRECYGDWRKNIQQNVGRIKREVHENDMYSKPTCKRVKEDDLRRLDRLAKAEPTPPPNQTGASQPTTSDEYFGMNSYAMYFKKSKECTTGGGAGGVPDPETWVGQDSDHKDGGHAQFSGHFPNQKIPVKKLLSKADTPLKRKTGTDCIRYFHIPTNNMNWVERAIARYYDEDDVEHNDNVSYAGMTAAQRVLCREFWRGQMHGSSKKAPVHGRHMRSRCSLIPCNQASLNNQKAKKDDEQGLMKGRTLALFLPYLHWENNSGRARMGRIIQTAPRPSSGEDQTGSQNKEPVKLRKGQTLTFSHSMAQLVQKASRLKRAPHSPKARLVEYFQLLAKLASDIPSDPHAKLFRANIHNDPPMHPRRTLDQYYFSTLKDTTSRDKDQVVYRGTKKDKSDWEHEPRIVMVDQLWLWILDDNTIITSFPRRWGQNKKDVSGVHKSLRVRFENDNEIRSVYHLALIIIDQCSKVFFDRTKPIDDRPEVIDIFGSAIGNVAAHTSDASASFWQHTAIYSRKGLTSKEQSSSHSYLRINPEGTILRESQDIAEELEIMLRVFSQQLGVVQELKRHIAPAIDPLNQNPTRKMSEKRQNQLSDFLQDADILIELIKNRKAELQDLDDSVQRTCKQILDLLTLKQQQASILEAKASQRNARASVNQGQTIMILTLVTVFFLPLGFFAAFFGMNNKRSTGDNWMTSREQVIYMFTISIAVVLIVLFAVLGRWYQNGAVLRRRIVNFFTKDELPQTNQDGSTTDDSSGTDTKLVHQKH